MLHLKSPAKINLFLKIIKKREDGFHELASFFHAISLFDEITFEPHGKDELTCSDSTIPCDDRNLIIKALKLYRKKTNFFSSFKINLDKKIPHQAGLGGGSSNAATTLWALNQMAPKPLSQMELLTLASELGSDVPFFLSHGSAFCTGRGEKIEEIKPLNKNLYIIMPKIKLATADVYKHVSIKNLVTRDPHHDLKQFINDKPLYYNDLEEAAFLCSPELRSFKQNLLELGFDCVLLSGSGSAFFCIGNGNIENIDKDLWRCPVNLIYRNKNRWFN